MVRSLLRHRTTLVVVFQSRQALSTAIDTLMAQGTGHLLDIGHGALIMQHPDQQPTIINNNVTLREGAISGGMIGAAIMGLTAVQRGALSLSDAAAAAILFCLIGGAVLGSVIGYLAARWVGFGFRQNLVEEIAARLSAGEAALVLQIRYADKTLLQQQLNELGAKVETLASSNV